jgi:hypothetical protein
VDPMAALRQEKSMRAPSPWRPLHLGGASH